MNSEIIGGQYDKNRLKDGWWVELNDNITNQNQVSHYCGEYKEGKKIGRWDTKIMFNNLNEFEVIGGGKYDQNEMKIGKWVELITNYSNNHQVTYSGFYQKGQKNGYWNTLLKQENNFEIIGGGLYEEGVKDGKWMELSSNDNYKFTHIGEYYKGLKINRWNIIFMKQDTDDYKIIGGGLYNLNGMKHGKWVEVQNQYREFDIIAYIGEYKNGKKYGKWEIFQGSTAINQYNIIGGGCYDKNGLEQGQFVEIEQFTLEFSVISIGKYSNGKKIEKWNTMYRFYREDDFMNLGSGQFDENGIKQGQWIEINAKFDIHKITYHGFYKDGVKVDQWQTNYLKNGEQDFVTIGGGFIDKDGFKQGKWMELHEKFNDDLKVTYYGDYQFGKKIGKWDTLLLEDDYQINNSHCYSGSSSQNYLTPDDESMESIESIESMESTSFQGINSIKKEFQQNIIKKEFQQNIIKNQQKEEEFDVHQEKDGYIRYNQKQFQIIGGGQFDKDEIKHGFWIETYFINQSISDFIQNKGKYNEGKKVGYWTTFDFPYKQKKIGGWFDKNGIKQGLWLEFHSYFDNNFSRECLFDFGEYKDGLKIGRWDILQSSKDTFHCQIIGGGSFDQKSIKYGEWVDVYCNDEFRYNLITISKGEYKNGKKFGKWEIKQRSNKYQEFKPICGGLFDVDGQKQDLWLEFYRVQNSKYIIFFGEYRNGLKIGEWDFMDTGENCSDLIITDGGLFDENGMQHGIWNLYSKRDYQNKIYRVEYKNGFRINAQKENLQQITLF